MTTDEDLDLYRACLAVATALRRLPLPRKARVLRETPRVVEEAIDREPPPEQLTLPLAM